MIAIITIAVFICFTLALMSIAWIIFAQPNSASERLRQLGQPRENVKQVVEEQAAPTIAERMAAPIFQLVPPSPTEASKLQKKLMLAGFRSQEAVVVYRAIQIVSLCSFPLVVAMWCMASAYLLENTIIFVVLALLVGFILPRYVLDKITKSRQQRLRWGLADALDLMVVSIDAGLGLNAAMQRVSQELKSVHRDISEEFELANLEIRVGRERDAALRNLADRTGVDDLRSLVAMLIQADRFGTSITRSIRIYAESMRTKRRQRAEQSAQKAAVKLLFPLTCFLFPAFLIVLFTPPVITLLKTL